MLADSGPSTRRAIRLLPPVFAETITTTVFAETFLLIVLADSGPKTVFAVVFLAFVRAQAVTTLLADLDFPSMQAESNGRRPAAIFAGLLIKPMLAEERSVFFLDTALAVSFILSVLA
jgi:hypothetical protein